MNYNTIRNAWGTGAAETLGTPLSKLPRVRNLNKIRGCLIGGAAGDALGYAVEFWKEHGIFAKFGKSGITEYELHDGAAWISDDTQMTLFTANGLLSGMTSTCIRGAAKPYADHIAAAYRDWYKTQMDYWTECDRSGTVSWLMDVPGLFEDRAPGVTCLTAIGEGCRGRIESPVNNSKGCGGVMRVAPIGLYFDDPRMPMLTVDLMGADAAALTHGHEMGYIPAAMLVHIVRLVSYHEGISLKDAVLDSKTAMERLFPDAQELPAFLQLIDRAVALSESDVPDLDAIHRLGEGWIGDEALAIAIYCALKYAADFDKALIASVNHSGDSDSTGAITGNILGAYLGLSAIPEKYTKNLELLDVLTEIADDLYYACDPVGCSNLIRTGDRRWREKYMRQMTAGAQHTRHMTDIHMHLVPGVDDGAADLSMALEMLQQTRAQGVSKIIATPHNDSFDYAPKKGRQQFDKLVQAAAAVCPDVKIALGCEVYCDADDMAPILRRLKSGQYPTMNGTAYVLMEFSAWETPANTVPCVEALIRAGYKPIIAHTERYYNLQNNMELIDRFRAMGAKIQVNAYSLSGERDASIRDWARKLVLEWKADFMGTDAHRTTHRPPSAAQGLQWLYENVEPEYADAIAWKNAGELLLKETAEP